MTLLTHGVSDVAYVEIRQIFTGLIVRYHGWLIEDTR
jgi:hypothetical protein